ncbi:MAG TPA: hypothetical protein PKC69_05665 [Chitinophagaceae bacterium]|nr:hypothetical protein [Chitinophagaceae bacterium]
MRKVLLVSALLLALAWALAFFVWGAGMFVHLLLGLGLILYIQSIISCRSVKVAERKTEL